MAVRRIKNTMTRSLGRIEQRFETLPKKAYQFWRKTTPKRTGNARRKTVLRNNEIRARYPYAQRLDDGYSRQAPDGMSKPTFQYIRQITKRMLRK